MKTHKIYGIEGPTFTITVQANNKEEAEEKAEKVYTNHFKAWPNEKIDEAWQDEEQQEHVFLEYKIVPSK